jgi:hypothetical protein
MSGGDKLFTAKRRILSMSKLGAGIVVIVAGLGLSMAVVGCGSSSGNSGERKMNADKMSGEAKMSPNNMDGKMSGENKTSK